MSTEKVKNIMDCSVPVGVFDCPAVVMCPVFWTSIIGFVIVICRLRSLVSNLVVVFHIKEVNVGSHCGCILLHFFLLIKPVSSSLL